MLTRRLSCFFIFFIILSSSLQSQEHHDLSVLEDSLSLIQRKIQKTSNDSIRQSLNVLFTKTLKKAIMLPGSFTYPFDSLTKMAKMTSPDKMFRIYNWNIPFTGGSNLYFCFLQISDKKNKKAFTILELRDRADSIPDPEHTVLGANNWYGALYYKIIAEKPETGTIYTLLGWQGKDVTEMQKVIDVLTFDDKGLPRFGKKIFNKYKDGENKRVIFKYSPDVTMALRYDAQFLSKGKQWNSSSRTFEEKSSKSSMIVFDRLVPVDAAEGKGLIIAPAGDIYDGFIFENGKWSFVEGVDARNR